MHSRHMLFRRHSHWDSFRYYIEKNLNASKPSEHPPNQSGGENVKCLGGNIDSLLVHFFFMALNGVRFSNGNSIGSLFLIV